MAARLNSSNAGSIATDSVSQPPPFSPGNGQGSLLQCQHCRHPVKVDTSWLAAYDALAVSAANLECMSTSSDVTKGNDVTELEEDDEVAVIQRVLKTIATMMSESLVGDAVCQASRKAAVDRLPSITKTRTLPGRPLIFRRENPPLSDVSSEPKKKAQMRPEIKRMPSLPAYSHSIKPMARPLHTPSIEIPHTPRAGHTELFGSPRLLREVPASPRRTHSYSASTPSSSKIVPASPSAFVLVNAPQRRPPQDRVSRAAHAAQRTTWLQGLFDTFNTLLLCQSTDPTSVVPCLSSDDGMARQLARLVHPLCRDCVDALMEQWQRVETDLRQRKHAYEQALESVEARRGRLPAKMAASESQLAEVLYSAIRSVLALTRLVESH